MQLCIRCMLCQVCFHQILHQISGLWPLLYDNCLHSALLLVFYFTSVLLLSYHTMSNSLLEITCYIYLLLYACAHDTIFNACLRFGFINTRVLIFVRHLALASPLAGKFRLPGFSYPGLGAWSLWILPVVDLRSTAVAWISNRSSEALSFQAPLPISWVFLL